MDCDQIGKEIVEFGTPTYIKLLKEFGNEILMENNQIDRKKLGKAVFASKPLRMKLN